MVLVFILLGILIFLLATIFLLLLSTFRVQVRDLEFTNMGEKGNLGYAVILSFYLFNKIKWISVHLNDEKMRKAYSKMQLEKIDFKKFEKDFKIEDLKILKKLNIKMSYLKLKMQLGTESYGLTAILVSIISALISILLPYVATSFKRENYYYTVQPIYTNKNLYKIQFNCIIQVKMVHIINVIYIFLKKGRSDLNERTTSNRGPYGYSYEQH